MGMATYYLKARFASSKAAQAALPKLNALINEGIEAESHWNYRPQEMSKPYWSEFRKRFPLVFQYLGKVVSTDSFAVASALNFGERDNTMPIVEGKLLYFSAYVWHFADWALLARFLKSKLGALGVDWISEESMDPFSMLNP